MPDRRRAGCCGSCYWFHEDEDDGENMEWGECGVNPPIASFADEGVALGVWPIVHVFQPHCKEYSKTHNEN